MTKQERQKAILALLQEKGELHVQTICRNFHIVAMTARRDLMELEQMGAGALRKAAKEGDERNGSFMAGQCAAMVHKEQTAQEMIEEMFCQAEHILNGASRFCREESDC